MSKQDTFYKLVQSFRESGDHISSSVLLEDAQSGKSIPASHLNKIQKWTRTEIDPERIHTFPVLMIDTAPTRNMVLYTEKSQRKSVKGWIGKTFLFNYNGAGNMGWFGQADHSLQAASQMARIYDAKIVKTPGGEIGTLGWFYSVKGIDETVDGFIEKLEAGILREVSIHVSVPDGAVCSIDNKRFQSWHDEKNEETEKTVCFDHVPGEKYGKQTCYLSTGEGKLEPLELSAVACPGSINAHVMKDEDVENYSTVSLREALGGSQHIRESIMSQIAKSAQESLDALNKINEIAKQAGITLAEKKKDEEENKENCSKCGHEGCEGKCSECGACSKEEKKDKEKKDEEESKSSKSKKDEEEKNDNDKDDEKEKKGEKEADPPEGDDDTKKSKKNKKDEEESVHLFSEDCPVCGSKKESNTETESQKIQKMKEGFKEQVKIVVETAREQIQKSAQYKEKAERFDTLFASYCADVAHLAVEAGMKKSHECDKYIEDLQNLSFTAVQEIKKALVLPKKVQEKEEQKQSLVKSMEERAKEILCETKVEETKDGKKIVSNNRPMFGLK